MKTELLIKDEGQVRHLCISNPRRKNALSKELLKALAEHILAENQKANSPVKSFLLYGDLHFFSAGFNIELIDTALISEGLDPISTCAQIIESSNIPVIAVIENGAFGGAIELIAACHISISHQAAKFAITPSKLGLIYPETGLKRLLKVFGDKRLRLLLLSATTFSGQEAHTWGFISILRENPLQFSAKLAQEICHNAPIAVKGHHQILQHLTKNTLNSTRENSVFIDHWRQKSLYSNDLQEGIQAFKEKRRAQFLGV